MRASGPDAGRLVHRYFHGPVPLQPRVATYGEIVDESGQLIDRGLVLFMQAPRTYTGEDVLEFHVHGSVAVTKELLRALVAGGTRLAQPGEFTRRAFLNGKLDLHAAASVADIIEAETRSAALAAAANMSGALGREVRGLRARLAHALEELAGAVDFPDEVPEPDPARLAGEVQFVSQALRLLQAGWEPGRLMREGLGVAIVGPPNAGKSSLLNALLGEERALVSEIAGTTRDTIEESAVIGTVQVRFTDTAGIRESTEILESAGIARSRRALAEAQLPIVVVDGSQPLNRAAREMLVSTRDHPRVVFFNKADLGNHGYLQRDAAEEEGISGSVFEASSLEVLRRAIEQRGGWGESAPDGRRPHLASLRELNAVMRALSGLEHAQATLSSAQPADFAVGDLQAAFAALGELTGDVATEEMLDAIFARFCIGK